MHTLNELARKVEGTVTGDGAVAICGLANLRAAAPGDLTFVAHARYAAKFADSSAAAVLVREGVDLGKDPRPRITVADVEVAMLTLLTIFSPEASRPEAGVHTSAWIHETARIAADVAIGPLVTIGPGCVVESGAVLHPGVHLYAEVQVGPGTELHSGVVIRDRCSIGAGVVFHQNVSIGADGFGYQPAPDGAGLAKIPHIGTVIIEDGVEIGANSCVDRAKTGATRVGAGSKIDNLVQIAHNCIVGRACVIAGSSGLAGSVTMGDGVLMGGRATISDHCVVGDGARILGGAGVMTDVPAGETWGGLPAVPHREVLRQWAAIRKLPGLIRALGTRKMAESPSADRTRNPD